MQDLELGMRYAQRKGAAVIQVPTCCVVDIAYVSCFSQAMGVSYSVRYTEQYLMTASDSLKGFA